MVYLISPAAAAKPILLSPSMPLFIRCSNHNKRRRFAGPRSKLDDGDDPFLQAAITAASLRFQESFRPDPLFVDPYAGCVIPQFADKDVKQISASMMSSCHYCLATKFIDDKLLAAINHMDGVRQVVLLTDGMDTRLYRLKWPPSTIIFDISPERIFKVASEKLEGVGAKIPRNSMFLHCPLDSSNLQGILQTKGFNGNRASIWVFQGLPVMTLASFQEILFIISSLAMKGCIFLGELPVWLAETEIGVKSHTLKWMDKLFMSSGFRVNVISYDEVARDVLRDPPSGDYRNILFVAEQLQLSDDQMESWRREFQRTEEEGDEDGFEDL